MSDGRYVVSLNTLKMPDLDLAVYGFPIDEKTAIGRGLLAVTNFLKITLRCDVVSIFFGGVPSYILPGLLKFAAMGF